MATPQNRPKTALLVIDVQVGVVEGNHARDEVIANIGTLVEKSRRKEVPVVWVRHSDEHHARVRSCRPAGRSSRRGRRTDRCLYPLDAPRWVRQGI
jgi:nicotinamidase-related amidase